MACSTAGFLRRGRRGFFSGAGSEGVSTASAAADMGFSDAAGCSAGAAIFSESVICFLKKTKKYRGAVRLARAAAKIAGSDAPFARRLRRSPMHTGLAGRKPFRRIRKAGKAARRGFPKNFSGGDKCPCARTGQRSGRGSDDPGEPVSPACEASPTGRPPQAAGRHSRPSQTRRD